MKSEPVLIDHRTVERTSAQIFGVLVCVLALTATTY